MVKMEVPDYYRRAELVSFGVYEHVVSLFPFPRCQYVPKFYIASYKATVQRSTLKLASVVNATADYRGGNNNAAWDAEGRTLLGKPASLLSLTSMRTYARNRAAGWKWNLTPLRMSMLVYELFIIEYATLHTQKAVNSTLTVNGYKQGGLGAGVTTAVGAEWNTFSSYYSFINCGASNSLGSGSGEVSVVIPNFGGAGVDRTFTVSRYRGIENFYGDIWEWQDGASVFHEGAGGVSKFYICDFPANFADGTVNNYDYKYNLPITSGYVKKMIHDDNGVLIPFEVGGGSTTYFCDYYYTPGLINAWVAFLRGGHAINGAYAGFALLDTSVSAAASFANIGSRLCYIP
jgi:hypothetical protein